MDIGDWVCVTSGNGYRHENNDVSARLRHFKPFSVGKIRDVNKERVTIWLIGTDETWDVLIKDIQCVDVTQTGDRFNEKICNICHCLLCVDEFAKNQRNKHGIIRRPSCRQCRTDIDKRPPKSQQAKAMKKNCPKKGADFRCPICEKRSIVGITAKIVADHNHHTGDIRDFICDSCNTGLGRFKNGENYLLNAVQYLKERDDF